MNVLILNGTTTIPLNRSPFVPSGNRNIAVANFAATAAQVRHSSDGGATWNNLGTAVPATAIAALVIPQGTNALSLGAAGLAYVLSSP